MLTRVDTADATEDAYDLTALHSKRAENPRAAHPIST